MDEDVKAAGVWFVYGYDAMPYPQFISVDELTARRYHERIGGYTFIKFWPFDTEFDHNDRPSIQKALDEANLTAVQRADQQIMSGDKERTVWFKQIESRIECECGEFAVEMEGMNGYLLLQASNEAREHAKKHGATVIGLTNDWRNR